MRKLFLSLAAAAMLAFGGSINSAQAFDPAATGGAFVGAGGVSGLFMIGVPLGMGYLVFDDIDKGGLNRKYVEVVPGAGYQTRDTARMAQLTHEFNVAMGYADDAKTTEALASAAR